MGQAWLGGAGVLPLDQRRALAVLLSTRGCPWALEMWARAFPFRLAWEGTDDNPADADGTASLSV